MISGWAVDPNAVYRYQVDAAFPLSDHADYNDLLRYVELVQPKRVLTLHGFAAEFARDLRDRGIEAWALSAGEPNGADAWNFPRCSRRACRPQQNEESAAETAAATTSEFAAFAEVGEAIAATPAKLEKVRLLAEYLRTLDAGATSDRDHLSYRKAFSAKRSAHIAGGLGSMIYRALIARERN